MSKRQRTTTPAVEERQKRNGPIAPWKRMRRAPRRAAAGARQAEREGRGDEGQLARLDALFGPGKGAQRERERLARRLEMAA